MSLFTGSIREALRGRVGWIHLPCGGARWWVGALPSPLVVVAGGRGGFACAIERSDAGAGEARESAACRTCRVGSSVPALL